MDYFHLFSVLLGLYLGCIPLIHRYPLYPLSYPHMFAGSSFSPSDMSTFRRGSDRSAHGNSWRFFFREADVENNGYKWLVGGFLEKYEFVNGKDDNPYMKWKIKMLETTNQIYRYKWYWHYYPIGQTNTDVDKKHGFLRKKT